MTARGLKLLFNEVVLVNMDRKGIYEGQARIEFPNGVEDPYTLKVVLTPKYGPFRGGRIDWELKLPINYPKARPTVKCLTKVFHPNISFDGGVCFNMFSSDWTEAYRLEQMVNGLLWLLANPNPDSALNGTCAEKDPQKYEELVQAALRGEVVKGVQFKNAMHNPGKEEEEESTFVLKVHTLAEVVGFMTQQKHGNTFTVKELFENELLCKSMPKSGALHKLKRTDQTAEFIPFSKTLYRVKDRAKKLKVKPEYCLKEMVWLVKDKPVLILANGDDLISDKLVVQTLNVDESVCSKAERQKIQELTGYHPNTIAPFGLENEEFPFQSVIVSERITTLEEPVYMSIGVDKTLLKIHPSQLMVALGQDVIVTRVQEEAVKKQTIVVVPPSPPISCNMQLKMSQELEIERATKMVEQIQLQT